MKLKMGRNKMITYADRMKNVSGEALNDILKYSSDPSIISFSLGSPAKEVYPIEKIKEIMSTVMEKDAIRILSYGMSEGYMPLREAFLNHIAIPKGIKADIENILITTGATQGIELISQTFINPGDVVLVESPSFLTSLQVFLKYGATLVGVNMDTDGIMCEDLEEKIEKYNPKMLYTIPTFQNPSGKTLPSHRRKKIAELADKYDLLVVEDDPYCDLRYTGDVVPPIKSFDETGNVILANSFSKILAPGLRVGTITATKEIITALVLAKGGADTNTTIMSQAICAEFLNQGLLPDHLKEMVPVYLERLNAMLDALDRYFPKECKYTIPQGGLFVWIEVPESINTRELLFIAANEHKVSYVPGYPFFINPKDGDHSLRLNFSSNTPEKIYEGVKRLGDLLHSIING